MRLILNDVDVDVTATKWHDTGSSVDRVLVLIDLNSGIQSVRSHLITSKVIKIEPVRLSRLAGNDTHSLDVCTAKDVAGQNLKRSGSKILVGTIKLSFLPRHEEVDRGQTTIASNDEVDSCLFQSSGRLATR